MPKKRRNKIYWERVAACEHVPRSDYLKTFTCATPECSGREERCEKCRVYITWCGCGFENALSGWSRARWRSRELKRQGGRLWEQDPEIYIKGSQ